jgi:hypothetical protein
VIRAGSSSKPTITTPRSVAAARQVEWHAGDKDSGQGLQRAPQPAGDVVVQDALPPVPDHDLREDDGQRQVGPLLVQRPDVVN